MVSVTLDLINIDDMKICAIIIITNHDYKINNYTKLKYSKSEKQK